MAAIVRSADVTAPRLCTLILLGCAVAPTPALALDPAKGLAGCTVDAWRVRDGLPGAWARALAQTPDGYLWVGTYGGLVRYGGERMVTLEAERHFERLGDVMGLAVARDGTLWVAPAFGDPICLRGGVPDACLPPGQSLPAGARLVAVDQDAEGVVWLATTDGLYRVADGKLSPLALGPDVGRLADVHRDRRGRLWIASASGLYVREGERLGRHLAGGQELTAAATAIFESPRGVLWAATDGALLSIDGSETVPHPLPAGTARPTRVLQDRDGNVWLGTRAGLLRWRDGRFDAFGRQEGLPDEDISALFEDREGSLWVGTRGGGVAQFTDRTLDARTGPPSMRDQWISTLCEDREGALWAGNTRGLVRWKDGQERTFHRSDGLPSDSVLAVMPGADGEIWVGTDRGLRRWRNGRFDAPFPSGDAVSALYLDGAGGLWVGADDGLLRVENGRLERVPTQEGFAPGEIRALQHDDRGTLWVSASGTLATLEGGKLVRAISEASQVARIRAILKDQDGTLWFGTGRGLVRRRAGQWKSFGRAEGLVEEDLYQLVADDQGFLWAGASQGILRISRRSLEEVAEGRRPRLEIVAFDSSDERRDVGATRTRQPGAWRSAGGRLWFASSRGVIGVDPRRLRVNTLAPTVLIESAIVDGRPARRGTANVFPPGSGTLEVHFAGITLLEPQKARHRYRLEGFDERWVDAGTRRMAYYTNLSPGPYRFRVQASNADGVWNETGDSIELRLRPHFYRTIWFYAACALGVAGLGFWFHRARVGRVGARYAATLAERARVARELHDSLLQGMSAVAMQLRGLRKRLGAGAVVPGEALAKDLKALESVVAANLEDTRRFVWDLREQHAREVPLGPALAALARKIGQGQGVACEVRVEGAERPLAHDVERALERIAQEAVANALKHAEARHIELRLCYEGERVRLSITDDGRGFDEQAAPGVDAGHFGLLGMRERAARVGALTIASRPGQGTKVEIVVARAATEGADG
jgi:signal transduction histidine kinase/ligand-binding sensor domain-containing protein